jgi:predicted DsbA family dithiol-disulfide isomerase
MNDAYSLYSDFSCPFCYAMHERLSEMALLDRCAWRGVQHAPYLTTPMARWHGALANELRREVTVVQRLAPGLAIVVPPGKPNTGRAIQWAARLLQQDVGRGMASVRLAYRALWCEEQDLSDPTVLTRLTPAGEDCSTIAEGEGTSVQVAAAWEEEWHGTGRSGVPLLVAPDGRQLVGLVSASETERFMR